MNTAIFQNLAVATQRLADKTPRLTSAAKYFALGVAVGIPLAMGMMAPSMGSKDVAGIGFSTNNQEVKRLAGERFEAQRDYAPEAVTQTQVRRERQF